MRFPELNLRLRNWKFTKFSDFEQKIWIFSFLSFFPPFFFFLNKMGSCGINEKHAFNDCAMPIVSSTLFFIIVSDSFNTEKWKWRNASWEDLWDSSSKTENKWRQFAHKKRSLVLIPWCISLGSLFCMTVEAI